MTKSGLGNGGVKPPKRLTKRAMRRKLALMFPEVFEELQKMIKNSNPSVRLGVIKLVMAKILPDLKAMEMTGRDGKPLDGLIKIVYENNTTKPMADDSGDGQSSL